MMVRRGQKFEWVIPEDGKGRISRTRELEIVCQSGRKRREVAVAGN